MLRYKCTICGSIGDSEVPFQTPQCCGQPKVIFDDGVSGVTARPVIFQEGWFEHIGPKPLYIKSRKELKAACKEHGCTSDYAE